jgi:hypothetical protein
MHATRYGKDGWSDSVGPLWFLQERWACGPPWRPCWARYFAGPTGITCQAHTKRECFAMAGWFVRRDLWEDLSYGQKEGVIMSWLREVRRPDGPLGAGGCARDPVWMSEYPAVHDYVTAGTRDDGTVRRTSTLTLFTEHGGWKVFLNDRDSGASLCATGDTVAGALSALEVMLEGENPPWRFSDRPRPAESKRGRKAT